MTYHIEKNHFVSPDGSRTRTLILPSGDDHSSLEWQAKQSSSLAEYQHEIEVANPETVNLYKLFKGYIAGVAIEHLTSLDSSKLLDIGCGISPSVPEYVGKLAARLVYVGLDPYAVNPARDYLFIQGTVEAVPPHLADRVKFDLFVFSTSLDHVESIDVAAAAVKRLAAPDAYCVFFMGLHDVDLVAELHGRGVFKQVFSNLHPAHLVYQAVGTSLIRLPRIRRELSRRRKRLEEDLPLDDKHFYYFTRNNVGGYLENFGDIMDATFVPGTNAVFACCKVNRSA